MSRLRALAGLVAALALGAAVAATVASGASSSRPRFDTRVFAPIPSPGFPALAFVHPNGRVYEGTYDNPSGDKLPSRVFEFRGDGKSLRSWTVPGQDLSQAHGVQVAASDARGRLILLDKSPARVLALDTHTGHFSTYAKFPDLPVCAIGAPVSNCSPSVRDQTPMPDYAAWGPDRSLYVTDYLQAVVWRVPAGGGTPRIWLADRRLDGDMFGTAGIALRADHKTLLISQASSAGGGETNRTTGKLYSVPIRSDGRPGELKKLWESHPGDAPDGFAIAKSGRIYLAVVGPASQLVMLAPDGHELARFPSIPGIGANGSPVPFDSPSSVNFLGTRLMVANQSFESGDPAHQAILDVEAAERGLPIFVPPGAGSNDTRAPDVSHVWLTTRRLRLRLGERALVHYVFERRAGHRWVRVRRSSVRLSAGAHRVGLRTLAGTTRRLRSGRYRVTLRAEDAVGNLSARQQRTATLGARR